jgi:hypothetical protein
LQLNKRKVGDYDKISNCIYRTIFWIFGGLSLQTNQCLSILLCLPPAVLPRHNLYTRKCYSESFNAWQVAVVAVLSIAGLLQVILSTDA